MAKSCATGGFTSSTPISRWAISCRSCSSRLAPTRGHAEPILDVTKIGLWLTTKASIKDAAEATVADNRSSSFAAGAVFGQRHRPPTNLLRRAADEGHVPGCSEQPRPGSSKVRSRLTLAFVARICTAVPSLELPQCGCGSLRRPTFVAKIERPLSCRSPANASCRGRRRRASATRCHQFEFRQAGGEFAGLAVRVRPSSRLTT